MASLAPDKVAEIRRVKAETGNTTVTAGRCGVSRQTVINVCKRGGEPRAAGLPPIIPVGRVGEPPAALPLPAPEAGGPSLPEPAALDYTPFAIDTTGTWGVISDIHLPFHDLRTINSWVDDCKRMNVAGILLNGDVLDCFMVSDHFKESNKPRMKEEIEKGRQLLGYLRATFPRARIVYKTGNHDERLARYLATRAPEVFDLDDIQLEALLRAKDHGVEWVSEKRVIMLGKLPVVHGHEYQGGGGVMPARWLFLRTGETAMTGHFHQPTFYSFRTITGHEVGMWSLGCACHLAPQYRPLNQWRHGWAMTEVFSGGAFHVHQRQLLKSGQVA
jgi:predicted phosphodiesterase